jgi:hypothetical protein
MKPTGKRRSNVMIGILRVARGRADGLMCFSATSQDFLASLAPLIAFPLVGAALGIFTEGPLAALTDFAMTLCALLTPAVLSYELARLWGRGDRWVRFATAFNWCEWILPVLAFLVMIPLSLAMRAGLDQRAASAILIGCLGLYGLWLHLFLVRKALLLSLVRAVAMVLLVNAGTVLVVMGPHLIASRLA